MCTQLVHSDKGLLVNIPFRNWVNFHATLKYHKNALQAADTLYKTVDNPDARLDVMVSSVLQDGLANNKHILEEIVRAIMYLTKQGLPFCVVTKSNCSLTVILGTSWLCRRTVHVLIPVLKKQLEQPTARNATYTSPCSQNDVINVIDFDIIRENLVKEVRDAKFYSVLADEASRHNVEHLSVCLRFLSFLKMVRAADIENAITKLLEDVGLSLDFLRGQGYDDASTMSREWSGVQKRILDRQPKALYTHCSGHSLNLVIKGITYWIKASPKRDGLRKVICARQQQDCATNRSPLLNIRKKGHYAMRFNRT